MASDLLWKKDANGIEHPAHEILLAGIREQCSEQEKSRIREHLTGCASCSWLHSGLTQDSSALDQLMDISRYPYYHELQSNQIWLHMQRGEALTSAWTGKRKRKFQVQSRPVERRQQATRQYGRNTGLRVFRLSFPVAFGLLLLLMTAAIVLAYTIASMVKPPTVTPGPQNNHIYSPAPNPTGVVGHHLTPTPTVQVTNAPSASATTTDGPGKGPTIAFCSSSKYGGQLIFICGRNFKAGDRVSLVLVFDGMNNPLTWGSYRVNAHGEFTGMLFLYSCRFVPTAVYAKDESVRSESVTSNTLTNFPMAGCNSSTPGNWPGGHS